MNCLVIKAEKIKSLNERYGESLVKKCFSLANSKHPSQIYWEIKELEDKELAECFKEIFNEII